MKNDPFPDGEEVERCRRVREEIFANLKTPEEEEAFFKDLERRAKRHNALLRRRAALARSKRKKLLRVPAPRKRAG